MPKLISLICAVSKVTHAPGRTGFPITRSLHIILLKYGCEKYSAWNAWKTCTLIEERY